MRRLFVAVDLPANVKDQLAIMCCGLPGAKWVPPEQLHLTLRFIGDVDGTLFRDLKESLLEIHFASFFIQLKGVGFFPPRGKPRVLWVGVVKNANLALLQKKIENVLVKSGLEPERRKFFPHITLARLRNTPDSRSAAFHAYNSMFISDEFPAEKFTLYSSVLGKNGAKHYVEQHFQLSSNKLPIQ